MSATQDGRSFSHLKLLCFSTKSSDEMPFTRLECGSKVHTAMGLARSSRALSVSPYLLA